MYIPSDVWPYLSFWGLYFCTHPQQEPVHSPHIQSVNMHWWWDSVRTKSEYGNTPLIYISYLLLAYVCLEPWITVNQFRIATFIYISFRYSRHLLTSTNIGCIVVEWIPRLWKKSFISLARSMYEFGLLHVMCAEPMIRSPSSCHICKSLTDNTPFIWSQLYK